MRLLIRGDARALPLADGSVDCVVTSPPYWGLRDYGTATWEGGDPACDHRSPSMREGRNEDRATLGGGIMATNSYQLIYAAQQGRCGKCGASRVDSQIGLEATPDAYVAQLVAVFREVRRVLRPTGTVWLNLGDSYAGGSGGRGDAGNLIDGKPTSVKHDGVRLSRELCGLKPKDLVGIPWRAAFALQADGWYLRSDIIWAKPNPMPESVTDRPTKAHEYLFLLSQQERYFYDAAAIAEPAMVGRLRNGFRGEHDGPTAYIGQHPGQSNTKKNMTNVRMLDVRTVLERNRRSVWTVATQPYAGAHFATMPEALIEPCILAGCPLGGTVLDPFCGTGTVLAVAERLGRHGIGVDLTYQGLAAARTAQRGLAFV